MNAIPAGYKQTEVGVIPEDWNAEALGSCVVIKSGESPSLFRFESEGVPYFKVEQLNNNGKYLKDTPYHFQGTKTVPRGSLIFPKRGASILLNKIRILENDSFMDTNLMTLTPSLLVHQEFIYYALTHIELWRIADTTSIPQINNKHIIPLTVAFPPTKSEQEAIAEALSDADGLIESLEQLLTKKRHLKQAAMQELLTGKKRLPGFSGAWEAKRFGEVVALRRERIDPRKHGVQQFCVELEHIGSSTGTLLGSTSTGESSSLKSVFRPGDVLFGKLRAYLRKYWRADRDGVCSTEIWVLSPREGFLSGAYLFQIIQTDEFIEAASYSYGTHMPRSDWNVVKNYELAVPLAPEEQVAIATLLSDMDSEISDLEAQLDKSHALKQGMMQKLLTGEIRLVSPMQRNV